MNDVQITFFFSRKYKNKSTCHTIIYHLRQALISNFVKLWSQKMQCCNFNAVNKAHLKPNQRCETLQHGSFTRADDFLWPNIVLVMHQDWDRLFDLGLWGDMSVKSVPEGFLDEEFCWLKNVKIVPAYYSKWHCMGIKIQTCYITSGKTWTQTPSCF